jgi:hypothetical protein
LPHLRLWLRTERLPSNHLYCSVASRSSRRSRFSPFHCTLLANSLLPERHAIHALHALRALHVLLQCLTPEAAAGWSRPQQASAGRDRREEGAAGGRKEERGLDAVEEEAGGRKGVRQERGSGKAGRG